MKRFVTLTALVVAFAVAVPLTAQAQMESESAFMIGPRVTLDLADISDAYDGTFAIGADARYKNSEFPVQGNAAFDFYFAADNVTVYTIDLNVTYPFQTSGAFTPYLGAGLGFTNVSVDTGTQFGSASGNDTGLNLVGGAEFQVESSFTPFVQGQFTVGDLDRFGITGGLLFTL